MKQFQHLLEVLEALLGPGGCPWDREQTLATMRASVLEEVHEVIEAIDLDDDKKLVEELGDLLFNVAFFCKLGEKEGRFDVASVLEGVTEKLIRRHPHVFGEAEVADMDAVLEQWEAIKSEEKGQVESALDGIPKTLPTLARAQKIVKRIDKSRFDNGAAGQTQRFSNEEELGEALLALVRSARASGFDAEMALGKILNNKENAFREWEGAQR